MYEKEINDILNNLELAKNKIVEGDLTPDKLSSAVVYMAGHLIRLGEYIAEMVYQYNLAYVYRKYKYANEFTQLSKSPVFTTIKEKDAEATKRTKEDQMDEINKRRTADRLKALHEDYRLFIMTIQTRLNIIKSELFSSKEV